MSLALGLIKFTCGHLWPQRLQEVAAKLGGGCDRPWRPALTLSFVGGTTPGRVPSAVRSGREGWGPLWKHSLVESAPTRSPRRGHHVELKWRPSGQRHEGPQSSARGGAPAAGGWGRRPEAQAL